MVQFENKEIAFAFATKTTNRSKIESLNNGMQLAKSQHVAISKQVHTCLDMGHVINAGPCLYTVVQDVCEKPPF